MGFSKSPAFLVVLPAVKRHPAPVVVDHRSRLGIWRLLVIVRSAPDELFRYGDCRRDILPSPTSTLRENPIHQARRPETNVSPSLSGRRHYDLHLPLYLQMIVRIGAASSGPPYLNLDSRCDLHPCRRNGPARSQVVI